ncbi:pirin family protein [Dyadobacter pollutisoli]|jgi:hypothetical protein|uniref:Quercetin 2,3-dioxygenase C-terminal cupin domain-containing protein n=1 Tax=Dyadobacter pollutisoli TaxID=2910158 RepID=A0A9E8N6Y3_9BACT|nr:hypothetical protein [Dyadobacter pollutisoli]WAC10969.1 hypothetical protein ON006_24880 [Dyadobacter pollutisoli]
MMMTQSAAQIYLESVRGHFQTEHFRSFRTFNFEDYRAEGREAFGRLLVVNDETLLAERSHQIVVVRECRVILLPLVGGFEFSDSIENLRFIDSGEAVIFTAQPGQTYTLTNPYEQEAINYLQIRMECDPDAVGDPFITRFDLAHRNTLLPIYRSARNDGNIYIGKYQGREEGVFLKDTLNRGIFAFIIEGAFEVQNRLLEKRDGLSVSFVDEIEFEALSNDAVILILEV